MKRPLEITDTEREEFERRESRLLWHQNWDKNSGPMAAQPGEPRRGAVLDLLSSLAVLTCTLALRDAFLTSHLFWIRVICDSASLFCPLMTGDKLFLTSVCLSESFHLLFCFTKSYIGYTAMHRFSNSLRPKASRGRQHLSGAEPGTNEGGHDRLF